MAMCMAIARHAVRVTQEDPMTERDDPKKTASIAEARDRLASLVHDVEDGAPVEITRRGRPVAVLVAYAEYQRLLGEGPSFWDALLAFRSATDSQHENLDIDSKSFPRDKSPGRPVDLS
jgi:prevent-host-death family protein